MIKNISNFSRLSILFLVYLSTLYGFTNHVILLTVPIIILNLNKLKITSNTEISFLIILMISFVSIGNNLHYTSVSGEMLGIPYIPLILLSFFIAQFFNEKVMKYLLVLIALEIAVAFIEYTLGITSIFKGNPNYAEFSGQALYYRKVAGLSDSSSVLSYKALIGLFIVHFSNLRANHKKILYAVMVAGVVFSFNRTVIISALLFLLFVNFAYIKSFSKKPLVLMSILFALVVSVIFVFPLASEYLMTQLSRGDASRGVDLSSRSYIWFEYWQLIKESPLFGSGSYKVFVTIPVTGYEGHPFHAHNSVLMLLATQGIIISTLYFILIAINVTKRNFIYIASIFIYSMAQYGVFWGISFLDVMLFYFLFDPLFKIQKGRMRANNTTVNSSVERLS
ncbi:O-antigen ligase family protein [Psychromonas hadalis]|uniref:O-antigen ligase family protein n=1 Tax=Psychromonas hadalis TaxID=211669 RepID=UPI0003B36FD5|nr:O-antigen ligase family protein [Psychromonas hadalis]